MSYATHQRHARQAHPAVRVGVLTSSDSRNQSQDDSGAVLERILGARHDVVGRAVVRDEVSQLRRAADELAAKGANVLVVNGGTGIGPRDVTIEAFEPWFQKELPGFGERFRALSAEEVQGGAWLSRATAATIQRRKRTLLLFLLPGSPDACRLAAERLILPELEHAVTVLAGGKPHA